MVWSTQTYCILTTSKAASPIHDLKWDPYTVNEFSSVGSDGTVLFWLLDETSSSIGLNVHEAEVPDDLLYTKSTVSVSFNVVIESQISWFSWFILFHKINLKLPNRLYGSYTVCSCILLRIDKKFYLKKS